MLSFATEFPVRDDQTSAAFIGAVKDWVLASPHTQFIVADIEHIGGIGEKSAAKGNESLISLRSEWDRQDSAAVRYRRVDDGLQWTTTVSFSRSVHDSWVAIRVFCESTHPATRLPPAKKPVLVRKLLDVLGGGLDGDIRVGTSPYVLSSDEIESASRMIRGVAQNRLPIVYVSATFSGETVLDAARLAHDLSGMAHVVVEPNRPFSLRLKLEADAENVYGGAIGIYWPDGGGRRSFFIGRDFENAIEIAKGIAEEVRSALTNRRPMQRCTWAAVQERVSRCALEELKASGSKEVNDYIKNFDGQILAKTKALEDADREIDRLKRELRIYENRSSTATGLTLRTGQEQDLFPSELLDIVLDAIADYGSRVPSDSRRSHVATAIVAANSHGGNAENYRERLKDLLRGMKSLDQKSKRTLEEMGFELSDDGKHYKIVFQGDDRYSFSLPKSGSDHRGGLNAASDIGRLLF